MAKNEQWVLKTRPAGMVEASNFEWKEVDVPRKESWGRRKVLVKVLYSSIDPAMRGWLRDVRSYIPPVKIGEVMRAGGVGVVVDSTSDKLKAGDYVTGPLGWQTLALVPEPFLTRIDSKPGVRLPSYLSFLGMTGMTAYFGLLDVGKLKAGDTVLVSGGAGATGSVVGQIAKVKGCYVVGTSGSDEKCKIMTEQMGFDQAINYKTCGNLAKALKKAFPKKIDVFFDNVGGDILDAALPRMARGGRIVICGAISQYNQESVKGPANYMSLLVQRASMQGFVVFDYMPRFPEAIADISEWVSQGKMYGREHIVEGLKNAPDALRMLFQGGNVGKLMVQVAQDDGVAVAVRSRL